ncbi:hypothetical protein Xen7305DRAFT_00019000 [Xenococcus sp. PCC 7305]|uniref:hypothetical protein n=1 Tax=Xenococcus sp. PCC 7305 TaxID=102125 RepID=UPI0002ABA8FD|nr:hypothetical protein [Xenococcus sp. PCC 7305]ELS02187.1 hypothetical protein Xen7305DRAFT_00019000 [Xenococcus sp. PCC 7305]
MFFYQAYGLNIRSDFSLPELIEGGTGEDLYIQQEKFIPPSDFKKTSIKRQNVEVLFGGNPKEAYLQWPGIATLLAKDGCNLIVDLDSDVINPQLLSLYILSEALGLILYQRGFFLLHASAVQIANQVIVFAGVPGAGKSTTATAFAKAGYKVLSDDMVAISLAETGKPMVYPAFPQLKIWPSAARGLGYDLPSLPRLFSGSRKRIIRDQNDFPLKPLPLSHIFFLETGRRLRFKLIQDANAFMLLARFFPLPGAMLQGKELEHHFQKSIQLMNQIELWKIKNPRRFRALKKLVSFVEQELGTTTKLLA